MKRIYKKEKMREMLDNYCYMIEITYRYYE